MAEWSRIARRIRVPLGFALAVLYLWLAHPTWNSILIGWMVAIPGLAVRALASGHVQKNERLTTTGPYAHTRHPLYLGSVILAAGFAVAARSWWIAAAMVLMFFAVYFPVIRAEEALLRQKFPEFDTYARGVPLFLPRLSAFGNDRSACSWQLYCQHREYKAALGTVGMIAALVAKALWISN